LLCAGCQEHEQGPQPLPAGGERLDTCAADESGIRADDGFEPGLELREVGREPGRLAQRRERVHRATPVWRATMPPPSLRNATSRKPAASICAASASGLGKRRTLAGRYV